MNSLVICTFSGVYGYNEKYINQLSKYILNTIMNLSWFFKFPLIIYIHFIAFIAILVKLKPLNRYSTEQSIDFYKNVVLKLPFSSSLDKLIRSVGFMKLYDLTTGDK